MSVMATHTSHDSAPSQSVRETKLKGEKHNPNCLSWLDPAEAWQNLCLPLRQERGIKICATTIETLEDARTLMRAKGHQKCQFLITDFHSLEQFIAERYDYEGI